MPQGGQYRWNSKQER